MQRRSILKAGLGAGSLFLPLPFARVWAQSEGTLKLLKAPKVALVVGNGKYKDAPELKNAPNDARAISGTLKGAGFAVTMLIDAGRDALIGAIRDYVHTMEQKKCVGLFYFAGHGVQLDWRNYMLPIDAVIDKVEDVGKQSVDVARLMEGLTKAANPMNVIILDACRENPFGTAKPVAQKGLSQMDAPTQTILAYATSPGNVASDGDGANGLYTQNLLREMKVPEAKIEDVFKRVRLGVRRSSKGAQIPWESTSLEEDFWFLPPKELKKLSEAEKEKAFDEELKLWESIRESKAPGPLEDYLRRYPSGEFTELAQLQLDRVLAQQGEKKIVVAAQAGNPYTQGTVRFDPDFKVGDYYEIRVTDMETKAEIRRLRPQVSQITDTEVHFSTGLILDRMGNTRRLPDGSRFTDNQNVPLEFQVGHKWTTQYRNFPVNAPPRAYIMNVVEFRVVGREKITVPAGTFDCFRVEGRGQVIAMKGRADLVTTTWWAPDRVRRPILNEFTRKPQPGSPARLSAERTELVDYKQA
jgi:hypothetical protein